MLLLGIFSPLHLAHAAAAAATSEAAPCLPHSLQVQATRTHSTAPLPPVDAPLTWTPVTLPDQWQHRWPGYDGAVWYRLDWQLDCIDPAQPIALALYSIVMAGEVYINHDLLWQDQHLEEPLSRSWNLPRYTLLPASALHPGVNHIWVRVHGLAAQTPGLGEVLLGDPAVVRPWHEAQQWNLRTLTSVNLVVSAVLGSLFLCAWLLRRSHTVYGWYAFNCGCWVLFVTNLLATETWPFPSAMAMARANLLLFVLFCSSYCVFTWRFGSQQLPRLEKCLWWLTGLSCSFAVLAPDAWLTNASPVVLAFVLMALANTLQFPFHAWRTRNPMHRIYAGCLLLFMLAGLHDMGLLKQWWQGAPLTPYSALLTMLALSVLLGREVTRNMQRIENFNQELTHTVAQACEELGQTLEREHALALRHSRLEERLQLSHDLHDSLGGSLVRSIAYVEQARQPLPNAQMLSMLKLMRDDLRQLIDHSANSNTEVPPTPSAWAAPLRHRFIGLFDALDIQSDWLIPAHWQQPPSALQCLGLTRVAEEALTNVLKHSRATQVHIELLQPQPQTLLLRVRDNGMGFDVPGVQQHGLGIGMRSMRARLERFHGSLQIQSAQGATILEATLQLQTESASAGLSVQPMVSVDPPRQ
ncbi:MAG: 7TM diverse intracellular signaling domain-containing protein [Comamonas sp.]